MPAVILNNISKPQSLTDASSSNAPLSFLEWNSRNIGIAFSDAEDQYLNYLKSFYETVEHTNQLTADRLKDDYKKLLERLQIIFANDPDFERYKKIDIESETDLSIVIPFYARKLKDIALFYVKKRQEIKNKKIEYNLVGSYDGLSKLLYNNIVSKFTKNEQTFLVNENPYITQSPEFSAISDIFEIEIEELYNTTDYYDSSESLNPFSCVFNNLCFTLLTTPLSSKADPVEANYVCNPSNETVDNLLYRAYNKYQSTNISYISGGYYVEKYQDIEIPLEIGNNFFYWYSGRTVFDIPEGVFKNIGINDITWTDATGGSAFDVSDLVFITVGRTTQGAWFQDTDNITVEATMSATMTDGKIFKFPYPDYGLSSVGGSWSGPGLDDTYIKSRKFFPTEEDFTNSENSINRLYWSAFSSISTVNSVILQDTTLGFHGRASNKSNNADKVFVSIDNSQQDYYTDELQVAWLYDFRQTQIPITPGINKIYFPLQKYVDDSDLFFNYDKGDPVTLSSINVAESFAGAVAGTVMSEADIITRNKTICGPQIEKAWLKAIPLRYYNNFDGGLCTCNPDETVYNTNWEFVSGGAQIGVMFRCNPNNYIRFVWTGESVDINDVRGFTGFPHDDSCPYKHENHSVDISEINFLDNKNRNIFEKWKKCSCQAIQYSPFGHNHPNFENYNISPDFIVKDSGYPNPFSKKTWLGTDGNPYLTSRDFARFYPELIEKNMGWGKGYWNTPTSDKFVLEKGKSYIYHRASANNCNFESPYFIINNSYGPGFVADDTCNKVSYYPQWTKAIQDENGLWIDAGVPSDMILEFGDFLTYDHKQSFYDIRKRMLYKGQEITSISGNFVALPNSDNNVSFTSFTNTIPSINFILKIPVNSDKYLWGKGDYGQDVSSTKRTDIEYNQFRIENEYLHITQPPPSDIVLNDKNYIEYKFGNCDSECFVWSEPLSFEVFSPIKKWNKIVFDNCVESEILTYLNREITNCYNREMKCVSDCEDLLLCGCEHFCDPTKVGLTAMKIDSDIVFNTELSGIPVFVNYYARNNFTQPVKIHDITHGEKSLYVPIVTGDMSSPQYPWRELLNQKGSNFIISENDSDLKSEKTLNFYNPKKIAMGRYETYDSSYSVSNNTSSVNVYRNDNYFDFPFTKIKNNSEYITKFTLGKNNGDIDISRHQTFIPYTDTYQKTQREHYGLYNSPLSFTPWDLDTEKWKESDIWRNYRNQYNINCSNDWYTSQLSLTSDVWNWQNDIYGNQYFETNESTLSALDHPASYNKIFIKMLDGKVNNLFDTISSISSIYDNISATLYDPFSGI